jgi:transcriptional regulator with XRE-family HTH domain
MYDIFMQLLQERGLTPYRVSMDTGIPQSTLSAWKRGKSTPKLNKLQIIADYLGVSVDYLLGENGKKNKPTIDDRLEKLLLLPAISAVFSDR